MESSICLHPLGKFDKLKDHENIIHSLYVAPHSDGDTCKNYYGLCKRQID